MCMIRTLSGPPTMAPQRTWGLAPLWFCAHPSVHEAGGSGQELGSRQGMYSNYLTPSRFRIEWKLFLLTFALLITSHECFAFILTVSWELTCPCGEVALVAVSWELTCPCGEVALGGWHQSQPYRSGPRIPGHSWLVGRRNRDCCWRRCSGQPSEGR